MSSPKSVSKVFLATLLSSTFMQACAFKNGDDKPQAAPTSPETVIEAIEKEKAREAVDGKLTEENVSVHFVENPEPGSYRMVVSWPKSVPVMELRLNNGPLVSKHNDWKHEFSILGKSDLTLEMIARGNVSNTVLSSFVKTYTPPQDLLIGESISLNSNRDMTANRIFFGPNGRVFTNGFSLTITAEKLIVQDSRTETPKETLFVDLAKIVTFPAATKTSSTAELAGSRVWINAKTAVGKLKIAMVGADRDGTGVSGDFLETQLSPRPVRNAAPSRPQDKGRDGILEETFKPFGNAMVREMICREDPLTGAPGPSGTQGIKGGKGFKGGSAGHLILNIVNFKDLHVEVRSKAGAGGKGGPGGTGFPGGLGGYPGICQPECQPCAATMGAQGPAGPVGAEGDPGEVGDTVRIDAGSVPVSHSPL